MIDGIAGHPFSAETLPPPILTDTSNKDKIIKSSQGRYGVKSEIVQEKISRWAGFLDKDLPAQSEKSQLKPEQNIKKETDNQPTLYDAICSICQKPTKVIFQPEKGRPIYCKSCLKKMKEVNKIATIPFHNPKERPQRPIKEKLKRKEINLSELKKALEESLEQREVEFLPAKESEKNQEREEETDDKSNQQKKGVIKPGQIVKF